VKLTENINVAPSYSTNKRITVIFRGSVTDGKDWPTNFNVLYTKAPVPALLKNEPLEKEIKLHQGFYGKFVCPVLFFLQSFDDSDAFYSASIACLN
jgi:hypothetical protein